MRLQEIGSITEGINTAREEIKKVLFDFDWSNENAFFLQSSVNQALDSVDEYFKNLFLAHGEFELFIKNNAIYLKILSRYKRNRDNLVCIKCVKTDRDTVIQKHILSEDVSKYVQDIRAQDFIWAYLSRAIKSIYEIKMSIENKFVIEHLFEHVLGPMIIDKYYSEKCLSKLK